MTLTKIFQPCQCFFCWCDPARIKIFCYFPNYRNWISNKCFVSSTDKDGWQYLFPVKNAVLRSRLALRCLDKWPLDACLEILAYCISDLGIPHELKANLQSRKKELQVYQKVQSHSLSNQWDEIGSRKQILLALWKALALGSLLVVRAFQVFYPKQLIWRIQLTLSFHPS